VPEGAWRAIPHAGAGRRRVALAAQAQRLGIKVLQGLWLGSDRQKNRVQIDSTLALAKRSFNADSEHIAGVGSLAFSGLHEFVDSPEAREGVEAFAAKRAPDFARFRASVSA